MSSSYRFFSLSLGSLLILSACTQPYMPPTHYPDHQSFVQSPKYLTTRDAYVNPHFLGKTQAKKRIIIHLAQQRGILNVDGQVAMDFPINIGTPSGIKLMPGNYRISQKIEQTASTHFGNIYKQKPSETTGICVKENVLPNAKTNQHEFFQYQKLIKWLRIGDTPYGFHISDIKEKNTPYLEYLGISPGTADTLFTEVKEGTPVEVI